MATTTKASAPSLTESKELGEFDVPPELAEPEEVNAHSFKNSDDAQVAFLQGIIDEKVLAQVVNKFGKPANPPYQRHKEVDGAYENKLPKWVFAAPEGEGLSMEERMEAVNKKAEEREAATAEAEPETASVPSTSSSSSSATSSESS